MCTALSIKIKDHYFGRNLDIDRSYGESVCVAPRNFPLSFRGAGDMDEHFAIIGMALIADGIPLFYDGTNEHGLSMAGLNFPDNAFYAPPRNDGSDIASFEFIPWILSQCKTAGEAEKLIRGANICDTAYNKHLPTSPLHWIIADQERSIVIEPMKDGVHIHDNPVGVLTNNPPFEYQLDNLKKYAHLRADNKNINKDDSLPYSAYCQGLGAVGLPGDVSSMSRFARITFAKTNSSCSTDEYKAVGQFFHLLSSVEMVKGSCVTDDGEFDITVYSSCINTDLGIYYYTTYDNRQINCVDMHRTDLNGNTPYYFPLALDQSINCQN